LRRCQTIVVVVVMIRNKGHLPPNLCC
jgi:hypothetical protein